MGSIVDRLPKFFLLGVIADITKGMRHVPDPDDLENMVLNLKKGLYNTKHRTWVSHNSWRWICEVLTLLLDLAHAFFYNWIMDGELFPYGIRCYDYFKNCYTDTCASVSPFTYTFPPTGICHRTTFGSGGGLEDRIYGCALPLNILYSWVRII